MEISPAPSKERMNRVAEKATNIQVSELNSVWCERSSPVWRPPVQQERRATDGESWQ